MSLGTKVGVSLHRTFIGCPDPSPRRQPPVQGTVFTPHTSEYLILYSQIHRGIPTLRYSRSVSTGWSSGLIPFSESPLRRGGDIVPLKSRVCLLYKSLLNLSIYPPSFPTHITLRNDPLWGFDVTACRGSDTRTESGRSWTNGTGPQLGTGESS